MENNKAQGQFNWIFVIVAGAIILGFFVMFAVKYIDLQTKKENAELTSGVYNSLYGLRKSSIDTETEINLIMNKQITVSCNDIAIGNFISKSLSDEFVFAPEKMQTSKIQLWMQTWNFPFRIANFFYLTTNDRTYYVIYDSDSENFVKELRFPRKFNIKLRDSDVNEENVIYFYDSNKGISIPPKKYGFLKIDGKEYPYFGTSMMYGAMFTDNYECMLERSLNKFELMTEIYEEKADMMFSLKPSCNYDSLKRTSSLLKRSIEEKDYERIFELKEKLEEQNKNLIEQNCEPLF